MTTDVRWRVGVSHDCIGSGVCAGTAPEHFKLEGGYAEPIAEEVDPDEAVIAAAESCPMEAILVRNAATDEVIAPVD
ncbi:hypothetical protein GCM10010174_57410 [Kutzneria viridogrisea]|uniref:Ferredoxin n=2 Tax=Kutzneria TaxID=43356 RepID=W5W299_9PSEU|nr:ferredoxin [Kutzneria albida]AHH94992.1 hypothetical protein KALB_1620 [Kutzneria albida DSM 43870]MBA8927652.1 ferredoxin [Kutzneria viridogrisea]